MNKKNKKERYQEELEERLVSLIASLFGKQASETPQAFSFRGICHVRDKGHYFQEFICLTVWYSDIQLAQICLLINTFLWGDKIYVYWICMVFWL